MAIEGDRLNVAWETIHIVQGFNQTAEGVMAIEPKRFQTAGVAKAAARILSHSHVGVIAWSVQTDPNSGRYSRPEELIRLGDIPHWFNRLDGLAAFRPAAQRAQAA
jgi:hypothetical protein